MKENFSPPAEDEEDDSIATRLAAVHEKIAAAAFRSGRKAEEVELLAVSKTFPPEAIRAAAEAGQRLFGESRVQECLTKIPQLPGHLEWHFIGHLQSNKIRKILPLCSTFHSIDSTELALDLERIAEEEGFNPEIYLQVNVAGDGRKFGFTAATVEAALELLLSLRRVQVIGLMTIPPLASEAEMNRRHYAALRELRDRLAAQSGTPLPGLSMGMSGDYTVAVEEGATIVRPGSEIFGNR